MEYLGKAILLVIEFLQRNITLYGYTFSLWGVIIFTIVAAIIGAFIFNFIFG